MTLKIAVEIANLSTEGKERVQENSGERQENGGNMASEIFSKEMFFLSPKR